MENLMFKEMAIEQGVDIVGEINPCDDIAFDFRSTYKCFTCSKYGTVPTCPPFIPDFGYFKRLILCYRKGFILVKKFEYKNAKDYKNIRNESSIRLQKILLFLEQQAFARNYYWAISFTGGSCRVCGKACSHSGVCNNKSKGRIPMEACGIDVFKTCKNIKIDIPCFPNSINPSGVLYRVGLFLLE
jgi:predicted metal-binding protein